MFLPGLGLSVLGCPQNGRVLMQMAPDYDHLTLMQKVEVFEHAVNNTAGDDLAKLLWLKSPSSEVRAAPHALAALWHPHSGRDGFLTGSCCPVGLIFVMIGCRLGAAFYNKDEMGQPCNLADVDLVI